MPRGKAKSKFNFEIDEKTVDSIGCEFVVNGNWCDLPKFKRCEHCIRCIDGSKDCQVMI